MEIVLSLFILLAGFVLLVKGADWFVEGAAGIAGRFGIPQLVIGLTIVAMGTSLPEAAVSITSALSGAAGITVGNVVGSNILNILLILGITSLILPIPVQRSTVRIEIPLMIAVTIVFLLSGLDHQIRRWEGLLYWLIFLGYLAYLFRIAKKYEEKEEPVARLPLWLQLLMLTGGGAVIIAGSNLAVRGATEIARFLGVSERFIGLTVVALGTSLPELVTSVIAARKGNADIAIGNIVGSNIFNILFVAGTSAIIIPVLFQPAFAADSIVAIAAAVLLWLCVLKDHKLTRSGGILMLLSYAAYFIYLCVK